MLAPPPPTNETERLAALRELEILDSGPEPAFEDLARLAAHIVGVPMALVALVDADRQWFKARYGVELEQGPRDSSFCGHVVSNGTPLVVSDTLQDERFFDNPMVTDGPRIRFYAGVPIRNPDGYVLGTLCALDQAPKHLAPEQLEMMGILARRVVEQLESRRLGLELSRQRDAARRAGERFELLFETLKEGVVVVAPDGRITLTNGALEREFGTPSMVGRSAFEPDWPAVLEDGRPMPVEAFPVVRCLRTGQAVRGETVGIRFPAGGTSWLSVNAVPRMVDGELLEVVATFHDITTAKRASERLTEQERLATVGTLAAGVGHEINNPLAYVIGNIEFALDELRSIAGPSPSARLDELLVVLGEAREGADKIRKIVRGLRALAREEVVLQAVDLAALVDTSLSMAAHEVKHKASVSVELGEAREVMGDESRLTQLLVNLLVNAAQSFDSSDLAANRIVIRSRFTADGRVVVEVEDTGPGIPLNLQKRVFDPFFTTKPVGQGTGLGLSVSRSIVAALGGELRLTSVEGRGATFSIVLPSAPQAAAMLPTPGSAAPRARILVVDDEVTVLNTIRRLLAREHDVVAYFDPREAMAAFDRGERFDLVLCDLMMPYLTGQELYERVKTLDDDQASRFVFVTGGATEPAVAFFLSAVPNERLDKPFVSAALTGIARRFSLRPRISWSERGATDPFASR